ncbi:hypothetical protein H1R20_g1994, partial [Candolleomyces eurysporus]
MPHTDNQALHYRPKPSTLRKYSKFHRTFSSFNSKDFSHCGGGSWTGKRDSSKNLRSYTIPELEKMGFTYVPYEPGRNVLFSDSQTRIVGGLVDGIPGEEWKLIKEDASASLRNALNIGADTGAFLKKDLKHRRGQYFSLLTGVSMGGGQKRPGNLAQRLRSRSAFYFLAPKLYRRYAHDLGRLYESQPELCWNFDSSIYPCVAFNCGPQSVTTLHFDQSNLSHGLCAVTPLGNFDWKKGGHLVLWELKLVLEFPPGTVALLPSAAVRHCNTPIQKGEERMSITQFAAGGLFRWVAYGMKSAKEVGSVKASDGQTLKEKADKCAEERWMEGLSLFSTTTSLEQDYRTD